MSLTVAKSERLAEGVTQMRLFCAVNDLSVPAVECVHLSDWPFKVCAYYRAGLIRICVPKTAHIGTANVQWSYPGYVVDRTPYGVIAHELGHHVDVTASTKKGAYFGDYSVEVRERSGEPKLTGYCPNAAEWFAEMFRLFVTNPDLLLRVRPRTYALLIERWVPVETRGWEEVLEHAPTRTKVMAARKIVT